MKKRILIISGIYPPDIGGPATFVKELIEFINSKKDEVRLITLQDKKGLKLYEKNPYFLIADHSTTCLCRLFFIE